MIYDQCERVTGGRASPHGWRATFGTWCDEQGVDTIVSELCLAHAKDALAKAYKRSDLAERRRVTMHLRQVDIAGPIPLTLENHIDQDRKDHARAEDGRARPANHARPATAAQGRQRRGDPLRRPRRSGERQGGSRRQDRGREGRARP